VSLLFTSNGIAFNIDDSFHYATYKHLGFEYGDAYTAPLPSSFDTFTHTFTEYINEQSPVVTFAAGLGYSYGNFQNWIYDQELLVFDGYLNVADPGNNLSESDIIIFPNPAQEYFVIEGYQIPEDLSEIRIYNIDGSIILKDRLVLMQPYDISRLASGLYWIQLVFNSDHSRWKKLIKK
jgi:hypothetical protein